MVMTDCRYAAASAGNTGAAGETDFINKPFCMA